MSLLTTATNQSIYHRSCLSFKSSYQSCSGHMYSHNRIGCKRLSELMDCDFQCLLILYVRRASNDDNRLVEWDLVNMKNEIDVNVNSWNGGGRHEHHWVSCNRLRYEQWIRTHLYTHISIIRYDMTTPTRRCKSQSPDILYSAYTCAKYL